jgi:ribosomal small subunit protein bTHX
MGRGDKKSRKGKIAIGSFGKSRPHHVKKAVTDTTVKAEAETSPAKEKAKKPSA